MKSKVYGKITVCFSMEVENDEEKLAFLEAGYLIDENVIEHIDLETFNYVGNKTKLKAEDWHVDLEEFENKNVH